MQFTYPSVLWGLLLLIIPIIVHLLQLRRFKKTPFTNVKALQKVVAKSRRSQTLKKYLLLASRILFLTFLVLAFAQPYLAAENANKEHELVVYLDNSFSMQAQGENGSLLSTATQEFLENVPDDSKFTLFTNDRTFAQARAKAIQQSLLQLRYSSRQLTLEEIAIKANSFFKNDTTTHKNLLLISDFQQRGREDSIDLGQQVRISAIPMQPEQKENASIDSAYLTPLSTNSLELTTLLSSSEGMEDIPVSLYNGSRLIAKSAAQFDVSGKASVSFTISNLESLLGRIAISDNSLEYDNNLYITLNQEAKVNVLAINNAPSNFLTRVFTDDEFNFSSSSFDQLNYSRIENQDLIILNQLESIPGSLQNALRTFEQNGGSILLIPATNADIPAYNSFLASWAGIRFTDERNATTQVTTISFNHPLFSNVFEKEVANFQYPSVNKHYAVTGSMRPVLSFQNGEPFLLGTNGRYVFTGALDSENSNFKGSPLIVPTLYSIGKQSLALPELYYSLGSQVAVDVPATLSGDQILKIVQADYEFIPRQQAFSNKVSLYFSEPPDRDGIFAIVNQSDTLQYFGVNYPRDESSLVYRELPELKMQNDLSEVFASIENQGKITSLWKWFVILALVFILAEVLIQKLLP